MANRRTEIQHKYDKDHCTFITMKLNNATDREILKKLASVPSRQGYIRQLLHNAIIAEQKSKEETTMEKTLYTAVIESEQGIHLIRKSVSDPTAEYEAFEIAMQNKADGLSGELHCIYSPDDVVEDITLDDTPKYRIKPEFLHLWGEDATEDTVITGDDVESIARGWDKTVADVIDQLIPLN